MPTPKQLFTVTDYDDQELFIVATVKRYGPEKDLFITKDEFNDWLHSTGRLDTCEDWCEAGNHRQRLHTMTPEEYWQSASQEQVKFDLYEFIQNHMLFEDITRRERVLIGEGQLN